MTYSLVESRKCSWLCVCWGSGVVYHISEGINTHGYRTSYCSRYQSQTHMLPRLSPSFPYSMGWSQIWLLCIMQQIRLDKQQFHVALVYNDQTTDGWSDSWRHWIVAAVTPWVGVGAKSHIRGRLAVLGRIKTKQTNKKKTMTPADTYLDDQNSLTLSSNRLKFVHSKSCDDRARSAEAAWGLGSKPPCLQAKSKHVDGRGKAKREGGGCYTIECVFTSVLLLKLVWREARTQGQSKVGQKYDY